MRSIFYPWHELRPEPHPDALLLLAAHGGYVSALALRLEWYANPHGDRGTGADDLAAEITLHALRGLHGWRPDLIPFGPWLAREARDCAWRLRERAMRLKRARRTAGGTVRFAGEEFDRFAGIADPKAADPAELAAEREEAAGGW